MVEMSSKLNLPYDVWTYIARLIPDDELWTLRTLNSAFFQTAERARYRHVELFSLFTMTHGWTTTMKEWEWLRQTWTGSRVRSLRFQAAHLDDYFIRWDPARMTLVYTPGTSSLSPVVDRIGHFFPAWIPVGENTRLVDIPFNPDPFEEFSEALAKTLASLSGVTDYTVRQVDSMTHYHTIYVMAFVWVSFQSNLTTLTMELSLESLHFLLLESPSIHFPNLEALSLKLHRLAELDNIQRDTRQFRVSVAPFINRHCQTVRSLTFAGTSSTLDITALLPMVNKFKALDRLECQLHGFDGRTNQVPELARFLGYHAGSLRHLRIAFSARYQHFEGVDEAFKKIFCVNLSELATLEMSYSPGYFVDAALLKSAVVSSIPSLADTLTTLILDTPFDNKSLSLDQVQALVSAFSHRPKDRGLRVLLFTVRVLSPTLVDLLASALPGLTKLTLTARACRSSASSSDAVDTLDGFIADMKSKEYYGWALRHISITLSQMPNPWAGKIIAERVLDAREFWVSESSDMAWYMSRREDGTVHWQRL